MIYLDGIVLLFYDGVVYNPPLKFDGALPGRRHGRRVLWFFLDLYYSQSGPPSQLVSHLHSTFPVLASPPKDHRHKTRAYRRRAGFYGMPLWTREEIS